MSKTSEEQPRFLQDEDDTWQQSTRQAAQHQGDMAMVLRGASICVGTPFSELSR